MKPIIEFSNVTFQYPETDLPVFSGLSMPLEKGIYSLVGQNGVGKSTFLLLAGGRLLPDNGTVRIFGGDTRGITDEEERNKTVSFVYQNMEFETEEPVGDLLRFVHENGTLKDKVPGLVETLVTEFDLGKASGMKMQHLSKGAIQRTIIAFSLLYGSPILMMDEPIFALEDPEKKRIMGFLTDYVKDADITLFYSAHELNITKDFSETMLLFYRDGRIQAGPTKELAVPELLEEVYNIPYAMLHQKENLFRNHLLDEANILRGGTAPENPEISAN